MAVELILKNEMLVKKKCRIKVLVGDDDSSAIGALKKLAPYTIIKWSDFNHVFKTWTSKLYEMKLSPVLREYFSKVFSLCVKLNKGDQQKVKQALENIIPHAFGDHKNCGDFCLKNDNGEHEFKYFKNGKCLTDIALKEKLKKALQPFINNSLQIAPCASSQANESFNNTVCSKHPKSAFYGGSQSHENRVKLSVCQKNAGYSYILSLNSNLELSPGHHTALFRKKKDLKFKNRLNAKKQVDFKKRRLFLKKNRASKNASMSNKEGITYKSGSGYLNTSDFIDEVFIAGKNNK